MSDGRNALALATSQDHKRLLDGDRGPNTGGMGAYSPAPVVTPTLHAKVMREIIMPAINGMAADGIPRDLYVPMAVGIVTSGISGWIAVWGTLRLVRTKSFTPFVIYRIALGIIVLVVLAAGWR